MIVSGLVGAAGGRPELGAASMQYQLEAGLTIAVTGLALGAQLIVDLADADADADAGAPSTGLISARISAAHRSEPGNGRRTCTRCENASGDPTNAT
ncbi:hypothetical protein [Pseudonocardia adelaidensis]|uniref:Uncharacterized protein n=1 Tax=Pseudonocardia adelaidensis TaxID=648754 RepID=A0ABP9NSE1_9PSEU